MDCYLKIHKRGNNLVVGVCDCECVGKKIKKGKFQFHISEYFFKGDQVSIPQAIEVLKKVNNFNIAGKKIVDACIKAELIHPDGIIEIEEIPIALKFIF